MSTPKWAKEEFQKREPQVLLLLLDHPRFQKTCNSYADVRLQPDPKQSWLSKHNPSNESYQDIARFLYALTQSSIRSFKIILVE